MQLVLVCQNKVIFREFNDIISLVVSQFAQYLY